MLLGQEEDWEGLKWFRVEDVYTFKGKTQGICLRLRKIFILTENIFITLSIMYRSEMSDANISEMNRVKSLTRTLPSKQLTIREMINSQNPM